MRDVTITAACDLTPRCREDSSCTHHANDCQHRAVWETKSKAMTAISSRMPARSFAIERIRDELLTLSWEGRRRALEWMWARFVESPRCSDDPKEPA